MLRTEITGFLTQKKVYLFFKYPPNWAASVTLLTDFRNFYECSSSLSPITLNIIIQSARSEAER